MNVEDEKRAGDASHQRRHSEEAETPYASDHSAKSDLTTDADIAEDTQLKRTVSSRKPPNPLCRRCKQGLTNDESEPCDVHNGYETDPNIVLWDGDDDPARPVNWPLGKKLAFTATASLFVAAVSVSSSIFGTATHVTAHQFNVGLEVMDLGISLHSK